jgi:hypothetical protein
MAFNLISSSPVEHEYFQGLPSLRETCEKVANMIIDLNDEPVDIDILLVMNDAANPNEFTLAFSGTTLAMDFYEDKIDVTDFDLAEGNEDEVLQTFPSDNINQATLWLFNAISNRV